MSITRDDRVNDDEPNQGTAKMPFDANGYVGLTIEVPSAAVLLSTANLLSLTITTGSTEGSFVVPSLMR